MATRMLAKGRLFFDYSIPQRTSAYLDCPETGQLREVAAIDLVDGGRINFPRDFSSRADMESLNEALPKFACSGSKHAG